MTLPLPVTPIRRAPSGDQATPLTLTWWSKQNMTNKHVQHYHTVQCTAIPAWQCWWCRVNCHHRQLPTRYRQEKSHIHWFHSPEITCGVRPAAHHKQGKPRRTLSLCNWIVAFLTSCWAILASIRADSAVWLAVAGGRNQTVTLQNSHVICWTAINDEPISYPCETYSNITYSNMTL